MDYEANLVYSTSPHHRSHLNERDLDPLDLGLGDGHGEGLGDVRAELHGDADAHHEVDLTDSVQLDVPDVHEAEHVRHHHGDHLLILGKECFVGWYSYL